MSFFGRLFGGKSETGEKGLSAVSQNQGGWYRVYESFSGAWQQNVEVDFDSVLTHPTVYACMSLIASDIAKVKVRLEEQTNPGVWREVANPSFSPVLRKPNNYQTRLQFFENWVLSRLGHGNAYVLKGRDNRGVVNRMWVLDPTLVTPLVTDDGQVFYRLSADNLPGIGEMITVPDTEIIHDREPCLYHPLVGVSPIAAGGISAMQGLSIQSNSANFFGNSSMPGGVLEAPGSISQDTADRLKTTWNTKFTGENAGKIAVLGDGLQFRQIAMSARDAQMTEQQANVNLEICTAFHVPPYKVGVGQLPTYDNIQALQVEYYQNALHRRIEDIEESLGLGLNLPAKLRINLDEKSLLRMDSRAQMEMLKAGTGAGILSPNEGRAELGYGPVSGGELPYLQEQNWSLADLSKRGDMTREPTQREEPPEMDEETQQRVFAALVSKNLAA